MATPTTYIKLDRNILRWGWYTNPNTLRVFLHLLLTANITDKNFENITVGRGETVTTYEKLSRTLDLSIQQIRTAVSHLKSTGEITVRQHANYQVITVVNYNTYQGFSTPFSTGDKQAINRQSTGNQQQLNNYNNYNNKNNYNNSAQVSDFDADDFFRIAVEHTRRKNAAASE